MKSTLIQRTTRRAMLAAAGGAGMQGAGEPVINVAVIGLGNRGSLLLTHLLQLPNVRIRALCDVNPAALDAAVAAAAAKGHTPRQFNDFRRMLDAEKGIDAVVMAVPDPLHKDMNIAVLEMGKHLYAEKPLALTLADGRMVATAAAGAKGVFQVGHQLRFDPSRRAAIQFVRQGGIGRVLFMQGARFGRDIPRHLSWYFDKAKSGDIIVDQAIHMLDLFTWAFGRPPLRAMGSGGIGLYHDQPKGRTIMDNYSLVFDYPDGARLSFSHHYFDPPRFAGFTERIFGSEGAVNLANAEWARMDGMTAEPLAVADKGADATALSLLDFLRNVRSGTRQPLNNAASALEALRVALLGRRAIELGRVVTWDEVV